MLPAATVPVAKAKITSIAFAVGVNAANAYDVALLVEATAGALNINLQ